MEFFKMLHALRQVLLKIVLRFIQKRNNCRFCKFNKLINRLEFLIEFLINNFSNGSKITSRQHVNIVILLSLAVNAYFWYKIELAIDNIAHLS